MLSESPYKIGLGPKILSRARLILGSLLLLLTVVTIAGVHQGVTSGDFDRVLLKPFREFGNAFEKAINPEPTPIATSSATLQSPTPIPTSQTTKPVYAPPQTKQSIPAPYPYKTYEQIKKEQDDWWTKVQEENRRLSEQSKKELEQFRQQSQQNLKEFEQQGQIGLEQFRLESEQKMEEFRQKYGIE